MLRGLVAGCWTLALAFLTLGSSGFCASQPINSLSRTPNSHRICSTLVRLTLSHVISWRMICVKVHQFVADEAYAFGCWQLKTLILWTSYVEQRHAGQCCPWAGQRCRLECFQWRSEKLLGFFFGRVFWGKKSKAPFCGPLCDGGLRHYHSRRCLRDAMLAEKPVLGTPCCHQLRKPTDTWARPISVL